MPPLSESINLIESYLSNYNTLSDQVKDDYIAKLMQINADIEWKFYLENLINRNIHVSDSIGSYLKQNLKSPAHFENALSDLALGAINPTNQKVRVFQQQIEMLISEYNNLNPANQYREVLNNNILDAFNQHFNSNDENQDTFKILKEFIKKSEIKDIQRQLQKPANSNKDFIDFLSRSQAKTISSGILNLFKTRSCAESHSTNPKGVSKSNMPTIRKK